MQQNTVLPALNELRTLPNWVMWRKETRNGKVTKVPYNAYTGEKAESDNPETWASYERATETLAKSKRYDGIGFMFDGKLISGVDLDHCVHDGKIDQWAQEIIDLLNSYAELSPSETGIHILVHGTLPDHKGTRRKIKGQEDAEAAIEMYDSGRYFTFTGKHVDGTPECINDVQEALTRLHQRVTAPPQKTKTPPPPRQEQGPMFLSDEQIIKKAQEAKNGSDFSRLWNGDFGGYLSQSEADQAFCNLLAFWCQKDAATIDRIFRRSGLYREKWDEMRGRQTYGEMTVERAVNTCSETYTGYAHLNTQPGTAKNGQNGNGHKKQLPQVIIGDQLRVVRDETIRVLSQAHEQSPSVFVYQSTMSKIERNEENRPIIMQLGTAGLRNELTDVADFYQWRKGSKKGEDEFVLKDIMPPKELAEQILALAPAKWNLLPLKAIVEAPVPRPDGTILDRAGYDAATRLYYLPSPEMKRCKIPTNPTQEDAIASMAFIQDIFCNFPFEGKADAANTIGMLFTPFIRHAITRDVQMGLVDANNAGTGKGMLTNIVSIVATGELPTIMPAQKDNTEWAKMIIAKLLEGPSIVVIDNIRGVLESAALEGMFTGFRSEDRILGQSKTAKVKNEATWMATGNNLLIGGDLPRRCYRIRLISPTANPEERDDFKIKDLEQWVRDHRVEIVSAILTVIRAWYVAGKPKDENVPKLASFSDWAQTIGGILAYAGVEGFQQNRDELRSRNNEEAAEWEAFLSAWFETFGSNWKSASDVVEKLSAENDADFQPPANLLFETLPQVLKTAFTEKRKSFVVSLPIQLQKRVQTVYGLDGYRIEKGEDKHKKIGLWRVTRVVAEGLNTSALVKKNLEKSVQCTASNLESNSPDADALNHTQPYAAENANSASDDMSSIAKALFTDSDLRGVEESSVISPFEKLKLLRTGQMVSTPEGWGHITRVDGYGVDIDFLGRIAHYTGARLLSIEEKQA